MNENIQVKEKDLNGVDYLNGSASVSSKDKTFITGLKGALAKYANGFHYRDEIAFLFSVRRQIFEFLAERFDYENLPKPLDKYRLEEKTIKSGSVLFIKVGDEYHSVRYTTTDFNMYDEPIKVIINEPKSSLNKRKINLQKDNAILFDNNRYRRVIDIDSIRYIKLMEKSLFQIEKNLVNSAPKGFINFKNNTLVGFDENDENPLVDSLEKAMNSENTFFAIKAKDGEDQNAMDENEEQFFIPVQFEDRIDNLIKTYTFAKEKVKELIGAFVNSSVEKKERLLKDEFNENGIAISSVQHAFHIRELAIKKINEKFGLNIKITIAKTEQDVVNDGMGEDKDDE